MVDFVGSGVAALWSVLFVSSLLPLLCCTCIPYLINIWQRWIRSGMNFGTMRMRLALVVALVGMSKGNEFIVNQ